MLWNLIIAYLISGQINARPRSESGGNLKLEILSGVVVAAEGGGLLMLICRRGGERDPRVC